MRDINIDSTFATIRQLPPEVEFASIEQFVLQQPEVSPSHIGFPKWSNNSNLLLIAMLSAAITAGLLLNLPANKEISPTLNTSSPSPSVESSREKNPVTTSSAAETGNKSSVPKSTSLQPAQKPTLFADVKKESSLLHSPLKSQPPAEKNVSVLIPDSSAQNNKAEINPHKHVVTMSSSFCTFGDDDAWIQAFVKALKNDRIINDTVGMRFTITGNSFTVNGKSQDLPVVSRYNDLYQSIIGTRLTDDSKISLSVSDGSCSLSKSIDD